MDVRSDAELITSVLAGEVESFAPLVQRYRDRYARFAVRMLGNRDDAEDVLQAVFVRAFRSLGSCRSPERFHAWLYQIVINECRTFAVRRTRREQRFVRDDAVLERLEVAHPAERAMMSDEIQHALNQLAPDQREAFVLKHVEAMEYDEMAQLTGAGVSALKMRVKRACERLRELLEGVPHD